MLPRLGPTRRLVTASLLMSAGNGAFVTCSAIYFTRVGGLTPTAMGLGLTIAGAIGLLVGVPVGHLADRRGPQRVAVLLVALNGVAASGYLLVRGFPVFVLVACLFTAAQRGSRAAQQALIAGLVGGEEVVRTQAMIRSVNNAGMAVGAAGASIALQIGTTTAFSTVIIVNALGFFASAAMLATLPPVPPVPDSPPDEPRWAVFRDGPFAVFTALGAVVAMHSVLLQIVLPLWITTYTRASTAMVTVLFVLNTVSVVLFQVRIGSRVTTMPRAVRASRWSGVVLCAACGLFALSAGGSPVMSTVLLLAAGAMHVWGELLVSAASWHIAFGLAPTGKQGQYQGFVMTGYGTAMMLAPTLLTFLLIEWGSPGWLVLGGAFLLATLPTGAVVAWAERTRRPQPLPRPSRSQVHATGMAHDRDEALSSDSLRLPEGPGGV
ncbi:MFS transporter [Streptomyces albospinus]|uniref:MFS transporter n=1 Tax=Streptomyces albospinus TaxID=285515 RepID=A0ABQ2VB91_9ACTN|nr:MFS transporter [Streptomyces albospinus]GGU75126.1 MFS transporter [Streptomyces albospinus]